MKNIDIEKHINLSEMKYLEKELRILFGNTVTINMKFETEILIPAIIDFYHSLSMESTNKSLGRRKRNNVERVTRAIDLTNGQLIHLFQKKLYINKIVNPVQSAIEENEVSLQNVIYYISKNIEYIKNENEILRKGLFALLFLFLINTIGVSTIDDLGLEYMVGDREYSNKINFEYSHTMESNILVSNDFKLKLKEIKYGCHAFGFDKIDDNAFAYGCVYGRAECKLPIGKSKNFDYRIFETLYSINPFSRKIVNII